MCLVGSLESPAKETELSLLWDGEVCRAEASPGEGLARALLWSGLAIRELQASEGQRPGNVGGVGEGSVPNELIFFFCPSQLVAPESGANLL